MAATNLNGRDKDLGPIKAGISDAAIMNIVQLGIWQSVGFSESKLSKERADIQAYYDGERPRRQHSGDSAYVSDDVWSGIESLKALLLDVFTNNNTPVKFSPVNSQDVQPAQLRTDYVRNVIFSQNCGYEIMRDTIEEALKSRNAVCKVYWDAREEWRHADLSQNSRDEIIGWLTQHPKAEVVESELAPSDKGLQGFTRFIVKYPQDTSQVRIKLLAGEEFGISPMSESIKDAALVFHRREMTISELRKEGYPENVVTDLQGDDRLWMAMEPEKIARFQPTDDLIGTNALDNGLNASRVVIVYESYVDLPSEDDTTAQLWKVISCGDRIIHKEPVDHKPFVSFCPLPRPNAFWGTNYAKKLTHIQDAKTFLVRGTVNHVLTTNNPKILVGKGALANPRELMENRFGGIVNVKDPRMVAPMEQASLNPFVFQTMQLLNSQKEESTGQSQLSQGLNPDAISKQNSQAMVHELISVSQLRQKIVARNFAESFLRELYTLVYRLVLENEDRQKIIQVAGGWQPVDPSQWPETVECDVEFALGYGEGAQEAQKYGGIMAALSAQPDLAPWFTPKQKYYLARKALQVGGTKDIDQILAPFDQQQQPPPNPMQQAEIAMKNADAAAKQAQAQTSQQAQQIAQQELQLKSQEMQGKQKLEAMKLLLAHQQHADKVNAGVQQHQDKTSLQATQIGNQLDLEIQKFHHQVVLDTAELALQVQEMNNAQTVAVTESASPKGTP